MHRYRHVRTPPTPLLSSLNLEGQSHPGQQNYLTFWCLDLLGYTTKLLDPFELGELHPPIWSSLLLLRTRVDGRGIYPKIKEMSEPFIWNKTLAWIQWEKVQSHNFFWSDGIFALPWLNNNWRKQIISSKKIQSETHSPSVSTMLNPIEREMYPNNCNAFPLPLFSIINARQHPRKKSLFIVSSLATALLLPNQIWKRSQSLYLSTVFLRTHDMLSSTYKAAPILLVVVTNMVYVFFVKLPKD